MASVSAESLASHGHSFSKKTFHKPTYCHSCTDMLWGLIQQGYICEGKGEAASSCDVLRALGERDEPSTNGERAREIANEREREGEGVIGGRSERLAVGFSRLIFAME